MGGGVVVLGWGAVMAGFEVAMRMQGLLAEAFMGWH